MQNIIGILIGIIALLVVIVIVLLWINLRNQHLLSDKNDAIIREIRKNFELRDKLYEKRGYSAGKRNKSESNLQII